MENTQQTPPTQAPVEAATIPAEKSIPVSAAEQRKIIILAAIFVLLLLAGIVVSVYFLAQPATDTAKIRDIFIIFMALETLLIGIALVILMIQLARLINLLNNEIKPIMQTTQETIGHLRGTTVFLSNNLVEPVVKLNEYLAGLSQLLQIVGLAKKGNRNKTSKGE